VGACQHRLGINTFFIEGFCAAKPLDESYVEEQYTMATSTPAAGVHTIIFACEAGMGSSVMGVNALKKKLKQANLNIQVVHKPVRSVPGDAKVIVVHKGLANLARQQVPGAVVIAFGQFLNDPAFDQLVQALVAGGDVVEVN
jgi:mannitol-specific phosphotransferase system IIBC component